ncbi:MAG: FAD-dependent monooxygenase, partial [Bacteroidia bacterium]
MSSLTICLECKGQGKKSRKLRKQVRLRYQAELEQYQHVKDKSPAPIRPKAPQYPCSNCNGSGLVNSTTTPIPNNENYPHVSIIGAGIGGVALAVACLHRSIPFTLYERDYSFDTRSQGYGLTLQQAHKAMEGFGIFALKDGVVSTRHLVHTTEGKIIGEWGMRKWIQTNNNNPPKRTNIHIARQLLRKELINQLGGENAVQWGHQLVGLKKCEDQSIELSFQTNDTIKTSKTNLVVGADGIRSAVRNFLLPDNISPLRYLGCIVI